MIHTSLSPNTERDDVLLALKLALKGGVVSAQEKEIVGRELSGTLSDMLSGARVFTVDSGRTALFTILKAAGIGEEDEVLIQAYTCVAVPEPVLWVGAKPVYVDCTDDLTMDVQDLRAKITPKTKAIVVQHTFGQPARVAEIISLAREKKILVIEDCAHALGSEISGKPVGTFGDVSFFSFGRDKSISSVFGGAITVPVTGTTTTTAAAADLEQKISTQVAAYLMPSRAWVLQQLMHPLVLFVAKKTYNVFSLGKIILEIAKRTGIISKAVQSVELSGGRPSFVLHQLSPALATLALHQLRKLSRFTAHRRSIAEMYAAHFKTNGFAPGHSYVRYAVIAQTPDEAKKHFATARSKGILLGDWYATVIAPRGVQYEKIGYTPGSCPNAERLAERSLNLPTHIGITPEMARRIIREVFYY